MTIDITKFGWSTKHGIMPVIAQQLIALDVLLDITSCGCRSEGKACSLKSCKCHNDSLSCTKYCTCESGEKCYNPHTTSGSIDDYDEVYELEDEEEIE